MIIQKTKKLCIATLIISLIFASTTVTPPAAAYAAETGTPFSITDESLFDTAYLNGVLTITGFHQPASGNNLTDIVVPAAIGGQKIRAIGSSVLKGAGDIHNLYLPDTLEQISAEAFSSHRIYQIGSYTYHATGDFAVAETASEEKPVTDTPTVEESSLAFTQYQLPSCLTVIGEKAFFNSPVHNIIFNSPDLTIGTSAFEGTENLGDITVTEKARISEIGEYAFQNSGNLHRFQINGIIDRIKKGAFQGAGNMNEFVVSETGSISVIEDEAFMNCANLHTVTLRGNVTSIGNNAFSQCGNMNDLIIDSATPYTIGEYAFKNNTNLHHVTLSNGIETIEKGTFENCANMNTVYLPDSLKDIKEDAFKNLPNLHEITINENVTIAPGAFEGAGDTTKKALANTNNAAAKAIAGAPVSTPTPPVVPVVSVPVVTPPTPAPPQKISVSPVKLKKAAVNKKKKTVTLTWTKNAKASGYTIYKKVVKKGTKAKKAKKIRFKKVKNVNAKTLKLSLKLAKKSTTTFYVKAFIKTKVNGKTVTYYSKASNNKKAVLK